MPIHFKNTTSSPFTVARQSIPVTHTHTHTEGRQPKHTPNCSLAQTVHELLNSTNIYACNQNKFTVSTQLLSQQHERRERKKKPTVAKRVETQTMTMQNDLRTLGDIKKNVVENLDSIKMLNLASIYN